MNKRLIAVYGTLKRGFGNNRLLSDSEFVGMAESLPVFSMISFGGFPGLLDGDERVEVEIWKVPEKDIPNLDALEGHPSFYKREFSTFIDDLGKEVDAEIYTNRHNASYYSMPRFTNKTETGLLSWPRR